MVSIKVNAVVFFVATINVAQLPNKVQLILSPISTILPYSSLFSNSLLSNNSNSLEKCKPDIVQVMAETISASPQKAFMSCVRDVQGCRNSTHPDVGKSTSEILKSYGYPVEMYNVTTEDGYILTAHRIPNRGNTPVYMQHGIGGCSDIFLWQYRNKSLAIFLWEAGYDVWLGNFRGTTYSLGHVSFKWNDPLNYSYWDFSWHENGVYDTPAFINLILSVTQKPKLFYIGYSMGSQSYLIALDLVPEMNDKIEAGFLFAPGGFIGRSSNPTRLLAPLGNVKENNYLEPVFKGRIDELTKINEVLGMSHTALCTPTTIRCAACDYVIFALFGFDAPQMNYTNIPNIMSRYPNIISVKTMFHYAQGMNECNFAQYDYGEERNLQVYGTERPPDYKLKNVRVKTYAFHGPSDNVFPPRDVERTLGKLPEGTLVQNLQVNSTYFNHADFVLAKDARDLVYVKVLEIMDGILPAKK